MNPRDRYFGSFVAASNGTAEDPLVEIDYEGLVRRLVLSEEIC